MAFAALAVELGGEAIWPAADAASAAPAHPDRPPGHLPATGRAQILAGALAGLELGARDRRILHWLAGWDTSTALTIASWITRTRARTANQQPQP